MAAEILRRRNIFKCLRFFRTILRAICRRQNISIFLILNVKILLLLFDIIDAKIRKGYTYQFTIALNGSSCHISLIKVCLTLQLNEIKFLFVKLQCHTNLFRDVRD